MVGNWSKTAPKPKQHMKTPNPNAKPISGLPGALHGHILVTLSSAVDMEKIETAPGAVIICLDPDKSVCKTLLDRGYTVRCCKFKDFKPTTMTFDAIIIADGSDYEHALALLAETGIIVKP